MSSLVYRGLMLVVALNLLYPRGLSSIGERQVESATSAAKSLETYWAEADLNEYDLARFLSDDNCLNSERYFLACVNSISSMADRMRLKLTFNGEFEPMTANDMERRLSEKTDLQAWKNIYADNSAELPYSFLVLWLRLKEFVTDEAKMNALLANGINAFLSVAKDPHTYIVPLAYYEEVLSQSESRSPHLGFVVRRVKGGALVRKVFSSSPAARSGLRKGDRIVELNGEAVARLHSTEFSELIRGKAGSRLLVRVERQTSSGTTLKNLEIFQGETQFVSVESRVLHGSSRVGLLTINKFARETCKTARAQLISLMEQSIQGLILDLRDNPGGQVDEAACVAGLFLAPGSLVFQTKYLDPLKKGEVYWAEGPQVYDGPIAALINSGSASAAEIVAGALKDLGRATLVGERSFGKGSFQDGMVWRNHTKIALFQTQGFYYFASGWTPQIVGIEPDLPAKLGESAMESMREEDLYLVPLRPMDLWTGPQALAWLNRQSCREPDLSLESITEDNQIQTATDWMRCQTQGGISGI